MVRVLYSMHCSHSSPRSLISNRFFSLSFLSSAHVHTFARLLLRLSTETRKGTLLRYELESHKANALDFFSVMGIFFKAARIGTLSCTTDTQVNGYRPIVA